MSEKFFEAVPKGIKLTAKGEGRQEEFVITNDEFNQAPKEDTWTVGIVGPNEEDIITMTKQSANTFVVVKEHLSYTNPPEKKEYSYKKTVNISEINK